MSQTYTEFELIIVNDASPEDLDSIVKCYDDPRIQYYINEENIGGKDLVAQWNHSLEYANGEYIILASDDDVYFPQYLEKMDALVCKYPDVNVFRPRVQIIDEKNNIIDIKGCVSPKVSALEYWCYWGNVGSAIGYFVFKKVQLLQSGGFVNFPMAWGSDDATVMKLGDSGICFENNVLYSFRMSGENISSARNSYITLLKKVEARKIFYYWMKDYLQKITVTNDNDLYYLNHAMMTIDVLFKDITTPLLYETSRISLLRVLPKLLKLEYMSLISVLKHTLIRILV